MFSLRELVQDVAQKFRLPAERKDIQLEVGDGRDALPVLADIGLIERVLENLLEIAVRHCPNGAVIRLGFDKTSDRVIMEISDSGHGIPPDELEHIFDRYYRVQRHEQDNSAGTGLGLAITKRIVELHGSKIRVHSRPGEGTTFSFDLPLQVAGSIATSD